MTAAPTDDNRTRARRIGLWVSRVWYAPMRVGVVISPRARQRLDGDVARWLEVTNIQPPGLGALLARYPEFRTLYCYRLRRSGVAGAGLSWAFGILYPGERTLHLACSDIGPGLFIQHGFATVIAARKVGANCWINQQVTIGFDRPEARPTIGDNVSIHAGAKVLGEISVGESARIGANAVVLKDVPAGYTAVGVPARLLPPKSQRD